MVKFYAHLKFWFIALNAFSVQSFKTDDSTRLLIFPYFYIWGSCTLSIAGTFFQEGFFKHTEQSNVLYCYFCSPKSLHISGEKTSKNKLFSSGYFFPRPCQCGTILWNLPEKLLHFTVPCIFQKSRNNWYRSFNTWLWLSFGLLKFSLIIFFIFKVNQQG